MNIAQIITLTQIKAFLVATQELPLKMDSKTELYAWMREFLDRIRYRALEKKEKGVVQTYFRKITGYSKVQVKRLLAKYKKGQLIWHKWQRNSFSKVYTTEDIALLHEVDTAHHLAGPATKEILKREYTVFHHAEYKQLHHISVAHIYNLRHSPPYLRQGKVFTHTQASTVQIGERKKPQPQGQPGFLRVDTVHQGDRNGEKGVYWINLVDEVTQSEWVFCVQKISEFYLEPILTELGRVCPFVIHNFHSDNGSEYINQIVAELLNKLHIHQTKSRSRKTNDNALVESKNGAVIRKEFGHWFIPATPENVAILNQFCRDWLNPYLNYHRPCGFASIQVDGRGKQKKLYKSYQTPYESLKSLPQADTYLKADVTFESLNRIAYAVSDTQFAKQMLIEKAKMFQKLKL